MITEERVRDALHHYVESFPPGSADALARTRHRIVVRRRRNRSALIAAFLILVVAAGAVLVAINGGRDRVRVEATNPAQTTTATLPPEITNVVVYESGRCIDDNRISAGAPTPCDEPHTTEGFAEFSAPAPTGTERSNLGWSKACGVLFERYSGRSVDQPPRYNLVVVGEGTEAGTYVRCLISTLDQKRGSARRVGN